MIMMNTPTASIFPVFVFFMFIGPPGTGNKDEREKKKERIKLIMMMTWDIEKATYL